VESKNPLLDVKNLNVTYVGRKKRVHAVRDCSFSIYPGESIGIVGESGSGKSTMAMALLRLQNAKSTEVTGSALFEGEDLLSLPENRVNELRWTQISVVFQRAMNALSPVHRISTQIEDIYRVHEPRATKQEIKEKAVDLLHLVNLPERVYSLYPHEMSGGMLQRVSIAISLLHSPKLLVFDEATTALDVVTQGQILSEVTELEKTLHTTRVMITHDMSVVASSCSKVAVMYAGELMEVGTVRQVLKDPRHPYSQGLVDSFPALRGGTVELKSIPGFLPDLSAEISGCMFAPRCAYADERCRSNRPPSRTLCDGRTVRCWMCSKGEAHE
jgi:peptide/nickel transport system ATP-binding protein